MCVLALRSTYATIIRAQENYHENGHVTANIVSCVYEVGGQHDTFTTLKAFTLCVKEAGVMVGGSLQSSKCPGMP